MSLDLCTFSFFLFLGGVGGRIYANSTRRDSRELANLQAVLTSILLLKIKRRSPIHRTKFLSYFYFSNKSVCKTKTNKGTNLPTFISCGIENQQSARLVLGIAVNQLA